MGEIFTIAITNVAVSTAPQDVLCAYAAATKKLRLIGIEMGQNGQTTVGNYPLKVVYLPATVTTGSGGAAATPHNINPGGAAASFTARSNDTTPATSSGTAVTVVATEFNPINGFIWRPPTLDAAPKAELSTAISIVLSSVTGTINVSATAWFEEI